MFNIPPTKTELLENIRTARAKLEALIAPLTETEMTIPSVQEAWTVKDILAHLTNWERLTMARLHSSATGESLNIPPIKTDADIDWINTQVYAENIIRPLDEVLADFHEAHRELMEKVQAYDEAFLLGPNLAPWSEGSPVWVLVAANTYQHYGEHAEAIVIWLMERKGIGAKVEG